MEFFKNLFGGEKDGTKRGNLGGDFMAVPDSTNEGGVNPDLEMDYSTEEIGNHGEILQLKAKIEEIESDQNHPDRDTLEALRLQLEDKLKRMDLQ